MFTFPRATLILGLVALPLVAATIYDVQVGANGQLAFSPEAISAQPGDQVVFHFNPKNHTVTQSSFANPCAQKPGGFNSGFEPVMANQTQPTFAITVNDTQPTWVFLPANWSLWQRNGVCCKLRSGWISKFIYEFQECCISTRSCCREFCRLSISCYSHCYCPWWCHAQRYNRSSSAHGDSWRSKWRCFHAILDHCSAQ